VFHFLVRKSAEKHLGVKLSLSRNFTFKLSQLSLIGIWLSKDLSKTSSCLNKNTNIWRYAVWTDTTHGLDESSFYTHAVNFNGPSAVEHGVQISSGKCGDNVLYYITCGYPIYWTTPKIGLSSALASGYFYRPNEEVLLTINNLIVGTTYETTLYSIGDMEMMVSIKVGNDEITLNQNIYGYKYGVRIIYRFVSEATSITIRMSKGFHLYGFSNRVYILSCWHEARGLKHNDVLASGDFYAFPDVIRSTDTNAKFHWPKKDFSDYTICSNTR
jgi:hypothetical protein